MILHGRIEKAEMVGELVKVSVSMADGDVEGTLVCKKSFAECESEGMLVGANLKIEIEVVP